MYFNILHERRDGSLLVLMLTLFPDRRGEAFGVRDADPKRGVLSEADDLRDLVHEHDAQPLAMVRAEGNPIVGQAEPQPNGGVPAVRTSDLRVIDVVDCGFHLESPKGRDEFALVRDGHAVFVFHAEREEQRAPSLVEPVREMLCFHELCSAFWMVSKLKQNQPGLREMS